MSKVLKADNDRLKETIRQKIEEAKQSDKVKREQEDYINKIRQGTIISKNLSFGIQDEFNNSTPTIFV